MTDYLLAAYGLAWLWSKRRIHMQRAWLDAAYEGLNSAVAGSLAKTTRTRHRAYLASPSSPPARAPPTPASCRKSTPTCGSTLRSARTATSLTLWPTFRRYAGNRRRGWSRKLRTRTRYVVSSPRRPNRDSSGGGGQTSPSYQISSVPIPYSVVFLSGICPFLSGCLARWVLGVP